jgi:hypothetical protein
MVAQLSRESVFGHIRSSASGGSVADYNGLLKMYKRTTNRVEDCDAVLAQT